MKKVLLSLATVLCALTANAQGISAVGANVVIVPSVKWDKEAYTATTWVYNTGTRFDTGGSNTSDKNEDGTYVNPNYNVIWGAPADDSWGYRWYEPGYDTTDEATIGEDPAGEEIVWTDQTAPFSSDEKYNDLPSYRWTTGEIMAEIYFRRYFTTTSVLPNDVYLACSHDDAPAEFYINGTLVASFTDGWNETEYVKLTDEQKALIKKDGSENLLAVHVHQNWGGAFADCGLYTSVPGGVDMGYVTNWTGKTLFNSLGGYKDDKSGNASGYHKWEKLYEAQAGDVYGIKFTHYTMDEWQNQVHFKTPIRISADKKYTFKCKLNSVVDYDEVTVKLTDNDNDDIEGAVTDASYTITAGTPTDVEMTLSGAQFNNLKIVYNFDWAAEAADNDFTVNISDMSVKDEDGNELFVGSSFFNYFYCCTEEGNQTSTPEVTGRHETLSWTNINFDDSQWDDTEMPIGSQDYAGGMEVSHWPAHYTTDVITRNDVEYNYMDYFYDDDPGKNTNYWIRRTFELDQVNPSLEYLLNICHDDNCDAYVNGHFLKHWDNWTDGKNPEEVHIKASYLQPGKNVIAVYIQQNWGGRFYDCGINVKEFDYETVIKDANAALAAALAENLDLTKAMQADFEALIAEANNMIATESDGAEVKNYFNGDFKTKLASFEAASKQVTIARKLMQATNGQTGYNNEMQYVRPTSDEFENYDNVDLVNTAINRMKMARKRQAAERRENTFTGTTPAAGDFYLYNVGEKQFLGGGESWGAHMALEYASNAMTLIPSDEVENGYVIQTHRPNGEEGAMDFANYGGYMDTGTQDVWVFVPVEGKTNVYNIRRSSENGDYGVYMGYRGIPSLVNDSLTFDNQNGYSYNVIDSDMRTASLESNQWMLITKAELDGQVSLASATNGVDMTHLISNPGFDQRLTTAAWENIGNIWGRTTNYADFVHENWNSGCALAQDIVDDAIIPGWYTLEVQGYYREGTKEHHNELLKAGEKIESQATLYAGDEETTLKLVNENTVYIPYTLNSTYVYEGNVLNCPDYPTDAAEAFEHGAYKNVLKFEVIDDGEIYFGIETPAPESTDQGTPEYGRWTVVDNFRLKYWGTTEPSDDATAISEVAGDNTTANQGIFNLAGQKLQKAAKGVNIINGRKVVVK